MGETHPQRWQIEFTAEARRWHRSLRPDERDQLGAALNGIRTRGPALGRPLVGKIKGSRYHNMKELRSTSGNLRALFAFGPDRRGIVLIGGDKTGKWKRWYRENIPRADRLYEQHLQRLGKEARWGPRQRGAGTRSAGSSR